MESQGGKSGIRTYRVTSDDYGTRFRRWMSVVLYFFLAWLLLFIGFSTPDFFAKGPRMLVGSPERLVHDSVAALVTASVLTLSAISRAWNEFTLEIASDHITVYEGGALDPLHRQGRTIQHSQIRGIGETRAVPIFDLGLRGLLIKYGRWSRWSGKRIFLPAGMPQYADVKAHLLAGYTDTA